MEVFCWGQEKLINIESCFDCKDSGKCKQYQKALTRHPDRIASLKRKWTNKSPQIEIIIRRKEMSKKSDKKSQSSSKKDPKYAYFYDKKGQEVFHVGTEKDIQKLYHSGGSVSKIFKLGDEMEVIVKLVKKKT
ncbi:hypothetical protein ACFL4T_00175 [candidate division KSB1 bacterium]